MFLGTLGLKKENQMKLIKHIGVIASFLLITACHAVPWNIQATNVEYRFKVKHYEQHYEINPESKIFKSKQNIALTNASGSATNKIAFSLHPDLMIDQITVKDVNDREIQIKQTKRIGSRKWMDLNEKKFPIFETQVLETIKPNQKIVFDIHYHLNPEAIKDIPKENIWALTISPKTSYAIGPYTGNNPIFCRNLIAPFNLSIKYPAGNYSCVPGRLVFSKKEAGYVIDTYKSDLPNIPTFSCAPYKKIERKKDDITVAFYLYPQQKYDEEMIDYTFNVVKLYSYVFGDNGTKSYRFGTVGRINSKRSGGENKGNAIYFPDLVTKNYMETKEGKTYYKFFVNHELFHNWNLFYVRWSGKLYEWFGEGGANFVAAWAYDRIESEEIGALARRHFLEQFIKNKGYRSVKTLEYVNKSGRSERALMYYYGALVWEQLRQKLGDEGFFTALADFFKKYGFRNAKYEDFLECMQAKTTVDVKSYLDQWIKHNAKIKLSINHVQIQQKANAYETAVEIKVNSNKDYELFTSLAYKTSAQAELQKVPVHLTRKGKHTFTLTTEKKPVFIQLDPDFGVPRINLDNCQWVSK